MYQAIQLGDLRSETIPPVELNTDGSISSPDGRLFGGVWRLAPSPEWRRTLLCLPNIRLGFFGEPVAESELRIFIRSDSSALIVGAVGTTTLTFHVGIPGTRLSVPPGTWVLFTTKVADPLAALPRVFD